MFMHTNAAVIWTHLADDRSLPASPEQSDVSLKVFKG